MNRLTENSQSTTEAPWLQPSRLSSFAIFSSSYLFMQVIWRLSWPILIPLLLKFGFGALGKIMLGTLVVFFLSGLLGYIYYWRFRFWIEADSIIVERWFFKLSRLTIPLVKVQSISIEQSIWKQLLDVAQVKIDSAGSIAEEVKLDAIDLNQAKALKQWVENKLSQTDTMLNNTTIHSKSETEKTATLLLKLSPYTLFKIGVTENHLRSSIYILIAANWINQLIDDSAIYQLLEDSIGSISFISDTASSVIILVALWLFISLLVSMFGTIFRFWQFELSEQDQALTASFGLTTKQEKIVRNSRIQLLQLRTNPLRYLIKIFDLKYKQAGTSRQLTGGVTMPGVPFKIAHKLINKFMDMPPEQAPILQLYPHKKMSLLLWIIASVMVIGFICMMVLLQWPYILLCIPALFIILPTNWYIKSYITTLYETGICKKRAFYEKTSTFTRWEKIQMVSLEQSPFGKWMGYAGVDIYTAGGSLRVSWLPLSDAEMLRDYCLYRLESNPKTWM